MSSGSDNKSKDNGSALHKGHRQRVKQRFIRSGLDSFQLHEILEFLLFFGIPYKDTNPLAHNLIEKFGSFSAVFDAPIESLKDVPGMTENAAFLIKSIPSITGIYMKNKLEANIPIQSFGACMAYLKTIFYPVVKEELHAIFLDANHTLITHKKLAEGSISQIPLLNREIQEAIFYSNASNVILAHNHPSGSAMPSDNDLEMTKMIFKSLAMIDVKLLDHIIIAGDGYYSMCKNGFIDNYRDETNSEFVSGLAESHKEWLIDE